MGKVYIQTVLDCFSRFVWARLYTSKMPVTTVQVLNNHELPFLEEHAVKVQTIPERQRPRVLRPAARKEVTTAALERTLARPGVR